MTTFTALGTNVLFQFLDETFGKEGSFNERSSSGLIIPRLQGTQRAERWGKVISVGAEVLDVNVGDFILIEPLMWTVNSQANGEKFWKTNTDKIMAVSNDIADTTEF